MRVTANTFPNSLLDQLNRLTERQSRLQAQAASGQRITSPEDDPVAMRRVMDLQGESSKISQYQNNIDRQGELANDSFAALKAIKLLSDKAREISISATDLVSKDDLKVYAGQVTGLINQAVQATNVTNRGDYIFSGTKTDKPSFTATAGPDGLVTGVAYNGNTSLAQTQIADGVTLTTQVVGENTTGSGSRGLVKDTRVGADFFAHMISFQNHLQSGDTAAIAQDRTDLAKDEDNFLYQIGTNAALQGRLEATKAAGTQRSDSLTQLVSKEVDADLSQTLVRLNQIQTAYQAALQSGGKILNTSLLDYLK